MAVLTERLTHIYLVCQFSLVVIRISCFNAVILPHLLLKIFSPVKCIRIVLDNHVCRGGGGGDNSTAVL